jgi:diguanylate cyclase (GGDEF)-like protein
VKDFEHRIPNRRKAIFTRNVVPLVLLVIALFMTYELWSRTRLSVQNELAVEFNLRARAATALISGSVNAHKQAVRSTASFFTAVGPGNVTREQFRTYIAQLRIRENYPGIQGIGYAAVVAADEKERHIAAVRAAGFPEYAIMPAGSRSAYAPVIYIEPFSGQNREMMGYDMRADPRFKAALDQARDTGEAAMTPTVPLKEGAGTAPQSGFFMFLPVYRNSSPSESPQTRDADIAGWVLAPFLITHLMEDLRQNRPAHLDIEIYDGEHMSEATRMFDAEPDINAANTLRGLHRVDRITVGTHTWLIAINAAPAFARYIDDDRPTLLLEVGISMSLLLALLTWTVLNDRAHAIKIAELATRLALHDALTELPNRKLVDERTAQALVYASREGIQVAFLFIDLDKFKPVNDDYGHAIGDLLLKEVGKRLQQCVRASDTVGRVGGDEFVALLVDVEGKQGAALVADKMLNALGRPFDVAGHSLRIGASIGIAIFPGNAGDAASLIKSADKAMYDAKHGGRSTIRFA